MAAKADPALIWRPLSEHDKQPFIIPRQWIVHTAVDGPGPTRLGDYFENSTSLESHTWLRWDRHEQLMDFDRSADANYKVNRFIVDGKVYGAISTETEDDGTPEQRPWNNYQVDELVRFGVWLSRTFGIPPRLPRTWDDWGMGWHSLYPMVWTNVRGKTCPGATRIVQFQQVVLPRIQQELAQGEDELSARAEQQVNELWEQLVSKDGAEPRLPQVLDNLLYTDDRIRALDEKVKTLADEIHAANVLAGSINSQLDELLKRGGSVNTPTGG